jgi:hypothetical protein
MTDEEPTTPALERAFAARLSPINDRLDRGAAKMSSMANDIGEIRAELARNSTTTNEVRELLDVGRNGLKVLGWLGTAAKWTSTVVAAGLSLYGVIYAVTHGGQLPPKP